MAERKKALRVMATEGDASLPPSPEVRATRRRRQGAQAKGGLIEAHRSGVAGRAALAANLKRV
eukprot:3072429-Prymnesium_polylepis.1